MSASNNTSSSALAATNANGAKGKITKNSKAVKDTNVVKNNNAAKDSKAVPTIPKINVNATAVKAPVVPASNTNATSLAPPGVPLTKTQENKNRAQDKTEKAECALRLAAGEKFEKTPFDIATDETATEIAVPTLSTSKAKGKGKGKDKDKSKAAASPVVDEPVATTSVATPVPTAPADTTSVAPAPDVTVETAPASETQNTVVPVSKEASESGSAPEHVDSATPSEHSDYVSASVNDTSAPAAEDDKSTPPAEDNKAAFPSEDEESGSSSEDASPTPPQDTSPSRQARLIAKGVAGPRGSKNKNKKKGRKPLDKTAKKDHNVANPIMLTMLANKDKNQAYQDTLDKFHKVNGVRVPRKAAQAGSSEDASMGGVTPDAEATENFELPQLADTSDPLVFQSGKADFDQGADNFFNNASDDLFAEDVPAPAASDIEEVQDTSDNPDEYAFVKHDELYEDPFKNTELPSTEDANTEVPSTEDVAEEVITEEPFTEEPVSEGPTAEEPSTTDAVSEELTTTEESPLSFLSFPNATQYPRAISGDQENALVAAHVSPLVLPVMASKPSRAEKKAAAKAKLAAPTPAEEPMDAFLTGLLTMPNGTGQNVTAREQQFKLVAIHVAPYEEPSSSKPAKMTKKEKKAAKLEQTATAPAPTTDETTIIASPTIETSPVVETSPVAETSPIEAPAIDGSLLEAHPFVEHDKLCEYAPKNIEQLSTEDVAESSVADEPVLEAPLIIELEAEGLLVTDDVAPVIQDVATKHEVENAEDVDNSFSTEPISPVSTPKSKHQADRDPETPDSSQPSPGPITASDAPAALVRKAHLATKTTLGIFSLEQFLDALEIEQSDQTTTKEDICATFADCSTKEFEDIQKRAPDVVYSNFESPITQRKIKMGKTTLYGFLSAITFEDDIAPIQSVIDAFNKAAPVSEDVSSKVFRALAA